MVWLELSQLAANFTQSFTDQNGRLAESGLSGDGLRPRLAVDQQEKCCQQPAEREERKRRCGEERAIRRTVCELGLPD
jgi:hypothetical protein